MLCHLAMYCFHLGQPLDSASPWPPKSHYIIQDNEMPLIYGKHFLQEIFFQITRKYISIPCQMAQLVGASSCIPKNWGFHSWSGNTPRLQVWLLVRQVREATSWCFSLTLMSLCLSLPLSFPSSLSEMNKHLLWERLKQKGSETVGRNGRLSICVWRAGVNTPSLIHEGVEHSGEGDKTRGANGLGLGL